MQNPRAYLRPTLLLLLTAVLLSPCFSAASSGIYLTDTSANANQYAWGVNGGCPSHKKRDCTLCLRQMLVCSCIMGNIFEATQAREPIQEIPQCCGETWDLDRATTLNTLYILSEDQVLLQYMIDYKIIP